MPFLRALLSLACAAMLALSAPVPALAAADTPLGVAPLGDAPLGDAPLGDAPLGDGGARHLLARTGFGVADPDQVAAFAPLTWEQGVDRLLAGLRTTTRTPEPAWSSADPPGRRPAAATPEERRAARKETRLHLGQLAIWWSKEMLFTDSPLTERLTLFWHGHFTTSRHKVPQPHWLLRQNQLLRREAAGNFAALLLAITYDPAMLRYLDGARNKAGAPNENYAREVMELFTLGEGHYTETDIKEVARALSGMVWQPRQRRVVLVARQHDDGSKVFLGRKGNFGPEDVVRILLEQPQTAVFITTKLWREFVSPTPDPEEIARLAAVFRDSGYEMRPLLRALFLSPAFRDPANHGTLIKSPADLVIGTLRLGMPDSGDEAIADGLAPMARLSMARMGLALFAPPNVSGWPGGEAWITSASLVMRDTFLRSLTRGIDTPEMNGDDRMMAAAMTDQRPAAGRALKTGLLRGASGLTERFGGQPHGDLAPALLSVPPLAPPPPMAMDMEEGDPLAALRLLLLDPAFQVK